MMMNTMDVPSPVRQMQLNMMMPSLVPLGLPATGVSGRSMNGDIIHPDLIRATLGQPLGHSSQPLPGALQHIPTPQQSDTPAQGIASSSQGMTSEHQVVPTERRDSRRQRRRDSRSSRSRSHRRRSSRHHRRHRDSRRRGGSNSDSEFGCGFHSTSCYAVPYSRFCQNRQHSFCLFDDQEIASCS